MAVKLGVQHSHDLLFLSAALLTKAVATFYNPVNFVNLTVPRIAEVLFRGDSRRILLPKAVLSKTSVLLLYSVVSGVFALPVGTVATLLKVPVIM